MKNKLWLCGITYNRRKDIDELTKDAAGCFDGLVWTDHFSTDGTFELLNERKGQGHIYQRIFTKDHDESANYYLRTGTVKPGDWVFIADSTDRIAPSFLTNLRDNIKIWEEDGVNSVYLDRPLLFRYFGDEHFDFTPHWTVMNMKGKTVHLSQLPNYSKENYIINTRDIVQSGFLHPAKYLFCYPRSNHCELLYAQFGSDVYRFHETARLNFIFYWQFQLKRELTIESLVEYFKVGQYTLDFIEYVELEVNMKDVFRLLVLNQPWQEVGKRRFNWSFKHYLKTGDISQENVDYVGVFNHYKRRKGEPEE